MSIGRLFISQLRLFREDNLMKDQEGQRLETLLGQLDNIEEFREYKSP